MAGVGSAGLHAKRKYKSAAIIRDPSTAVTAARPGTMRHSLNSVWVEILKHLDGDLVIVPRPSTAGERRAEISGRGKSASLRRDQEAVCLQVVAGAGFAEYYTQPTALWIDLIL
ncbi:MAG TPA: hypothetical protein VJX92_27700 [Methylomirabilota bacterium]|nr:hypothetical protein [Methylomirabilota bacterium]